jgi:Zn-dependent protease
MNLPAGWDFSIGRFPIRVHWSFLLIALLLGFNVNNLLSTLTWVIVVFVSVLLHELGHAFVAERYGLFPIISLHSMGGLTIFSRAIKLKPTQDIFISLAGPLTGFTLGGVVYLVAYFLPEIPPLLAIVLSQVIWVNIGWGVINLIPMLPFDGGQVMRSLWLWLRNPYDERTPIIISIVIGVLAVGAGLWMRQLYITILAAWLTYSNYLRLQGNRPQIF